MSKSEKILVSGDVNGNLSQLFKRVNTVNQKSGPFSLLICVGEFFGPDQSDWEKCKAGLIQVPIPTYILGPNSSKMEEYFPNRKGCELMENLIYLGSGGIYPCGSGLKIAYLSGRDPKISGDQGNNFGFSLTDIKNLEINAGMNPQIDILITNEWPKGVCRYAKPPDGLDTDAVGSLLITRLAQNLKPRYHFAATEGHFYERLPYRNHEVLKEMSHHVTRFIALAAVANQEKRKWLYAFNVVPIVHSPPSELSHQPNDVTEHPYPRDVISQTEKLYSDKTHRSDGNQFFYDMSSQRNDGQGGKKRRNKYDRNSSEFVKRKPPELKGPCWFCLASPDVEKHLVISVGTCSYMALAKGGLVPHHLLLLPIEHFQSTSDIDEDCKKEIESFKSGLRKLFKEIGKDIVFFERNYRTQHMQVQAVPVPLNFSEHLKDTFMDIGENSGIKLDEIPQFSDISQLAPPGTPFFLVELPTGEKLFHRIKKGFPLNFGRELLACPPLLNIPDRVDWRECKLSTSEETEIRDALRESFKPYDFTLDDDSDDSDD